MISAEEIIRKIVLDNVEDKQGVKATLLAVKVASGALPYTPDDYDLPNLLDKMVRAGEIVEIEYILPSMPERIKSFLLPAGTKIRSLRGGGVVFMFTPDGMLSHVESVPPV